VTRAKTRTWLDYAVWAVAAAVVVLLAYLGYAVWAQRNYAAQTSPAGRAVLNLEGLVRKRPNDVAGRIRLAQAYTVADRIDDAVTQYQMALKLDKENPEALTGLGLIAMDAKQWRSAQAYWQRVVDRLDKGEFAGKDTRLETGYYYLGLSLMEQKKEQDAVSYFKEALRIRRDASDTHYALSVAYKRLGLEDKSREELEYALMFDPGMPEANYDAGQLLLKDGDVASAAERFRLSLDRAPKREEPRQALDAIGTVDQHYSKALSLQKSSVTSATVEARIAVALDPKDVDAVRLLAQLYESQKKKPEALGAYQKLLTLVPDDKTAADAVKRLSKSGK
jgi:tetratricopeptide (TPR) repeat protein